ncbi:MAG: hypothetical protein ACLFVB_03050 [Thermoplasmata archaeon]
MIGNETLMFWFYHLLIVSGFFVLSFVGHWAYWRWKGEYDKSMEDWNILAIFGIVIILIPLFAGIFTGDIFEATFEDLIPILMYITFGFLAIFFIFLGSVLAKKIALPIEG